MSSSIDTFSTKLVFKGQAFWELSKPRLSFLVTFSSAFGYLLASSGGFNPLNLLMFSLGGFLISAASVTLNQITERKYDLLMKRTQFRPLPTSRLTNREAMEFAIVSGILGLSLVWYFATPMAGIISIISLILYAFVYTPLKRVGPIAVFVGAIPGALPPLIGWVAATGLISHEALIIFGIQFIWQFPHFWAIAWISDDDYKKAGFKLLPGGGRKDLNTAVNIMVYTLFLLPLGLLPSYFGLTGLTSGIVATVCGVLFLAQTFQLIKDTSHKSARRIMFGSFLYLPIVQVAYLMDKI